MTQREEDVLQTALDWKKAGRDVAIATVTSTWGSSPRPAGSQLVVDGSGAMVGSVSGGCIAGAGVGGGGGDAGRAKKKKKPRLLDFGVTNEQAWEVGLACGGKLQVYVERL